MGRYRVSRFATVELRVLRIGLRSDAEVRERALAVVVKDG
jgi:hypothetical protein